MAGIVLNKGLKPFDIYFADIDEHATIYFNPADSDLPKRLMEAQKIIEEKSAEIKPFEVDESGMPNADSCIEHFNERNKIVCEALDYAFGNKVSDILFKHCGAFSIVDGEYFILQFLNAITPELEKIVKKSQKQASAKANKYLEKYRKS